MQMAWGVVLAVSIGVSGRGFAAERPTEQSTDFSRSASVEISRTHQTWIAESQKLLESGQTALGLKRLQSVLDAEPSFVSHGRGIQPSHRTAHRVLESRPLAEWKSYENQFGSIARRNVDAALKARDFPALRVLAEQYRFTEAGLEALRMSTNWYFDQGHSLPAASGYRAIREHPLVRKFPQHRMHASDVVRWLASLSDLGLHEEAERIAALYHTQLAGLLGQNPREHPLLVNRLLPAKPVSPDFVLPSSKAIWQQTFSSTQEGELLLKGIEQEFRHRGFSRLPSSSPLIAGDLVITRTLSEVIALDRNTGKVRWRKSHHSKLIELSSNTGLMANPGFQQLITWQLAAAAFADRNAGQISSDGERVFAVLTEPSHNRVLEIPALGGNPEYIENWMTPPCQLLALDLKSGEELWRSPAVLPRRDPVLPTTKGETPKPDLSPFYFGPPTVWGKSLYGIGQENRKLSLMVFDPQTGKREWSLPLAMMDSPLDKDKTRRRFANPVVFHRGLLLCPTGAGMLAAVDPVSRTCRWLFRYQREDLPRKTPGVIFVSEHNWNVSVDRWWSGWQDVQIQIHQETILLASPESQHLHAVSLTTGEPLWSIPKGDGLFLTNVVDQGVLLIGSKTVRLLDPATGKILWSQAIPQPGGRGAMIATPTGNRYLLPLEAGGAMVLDPKHKTAKRTFPQTPLPSGNLAAEGETILLQNGNSLSRLAPLLETRPPTDPAHQFQWAKTQHELGQFRAAVTMFKTLQHPANAKPVQEALRTSLLAELAVHPENANAIARELEPLLTTTETRIQGFLGLAEAQQISGDPLAALNWWIKLIEQNPAGDVISRIDPALTVSNVRFLQAAILDLLNTADPNIQPKLIERLDAYRQQTLNRRDPFAVSRFAQRFDQLRWGQDLIVQNEHRTGIGNSALEKDLELWAMTEPGHTRELKAAALRRLAEDRESELRHREAAFFHQELKDRFDDAKFPNGQGVKAYLDSFPKDSPVRKALEASPLADWPTSKPAITQETRKGRITDFAVLNVAAAPGSLCAGLNVWLDVQQGRLRFSGGGHPGFWDLKLPSSRLKLFEAGTLDHAWGSGVAFGLPIWDATFRNRPAQ